MSRILEATFAILTLTTACDSARGEPGPIDSTTVRGMSLVSAAQSDGERLYLRCAFCHMPNGQGVTGQIPPLAGSEYVNAPNPAVPITIVLRGVQGPITVRGVPYHSAMTAYGTGVPMNNEEVAAVLTYIRSAWGNAASLVTAGAVAAVRADVRDKAGPVTAAELAVIARSAAIARAADLP